MTTNDDDHPTNDAVESPSTLQDLISRAKALLKELEAFKQHLRSIREDASVEIAHFRGTVQSELAMLSKLSQKPENDAAKHVARSSNLPFLETVWSAAKRSRKLVALQKRVYWNRSGESGELIHAMKGVALNGGRTGGGAQHQRRIEKVDGAGSAVVDIVSAGGQQWTKISLITNTRLLFDLAKQGWESGGSSEEEFDDEGNLKEVENSKVDDDDCDVPLLKTAKDLSRAALELRVRTKHPSIHLVLPRITPGETVEVDEVLDSVRTTGAILHCGDKSTNSISLDDALRIMAPDPFASFSETLNIDCTILLAIVSEFSHAKVAKEPWFHTALQRQVEVEDNENLLPSILYPAMGHHVLVCTREAAIRMREIVDTIGTPSEKARTKILMGDDTSKSSERLLEEMSEWSAYPVPEGWRLPIQIVIYNDSLAVSSLPAQAKRIKGQMTPINQSVFLYGWSMGFTTITSNRTVVKQIENDLGIYEELDEASWPKLWLCPTARSLVGKEKRGPKKAQKADDRPLAEKGRMDPLSPDSFGQNGLDVLGIGEGHQAEDSRFGNK